MRMLIIPINNYNTISHILAGITWISSIIIIQVEIPGLSNLYLIYYVLRNKVVAYV